MARNRLTKIGTIHSRTVGLLKSGAMKEEDRPLWFDVYEAFPPKDEPRFDRPVSKLPIREIFYEEDLIRAKYHRDNPTLPFVRLNSDRPSQTQRFIEAYRQLEKSGIAKSELYSAAVSQTSTSSGAPKTAKPEKPTEKPTRRAGHTETTESIQLDISKILKDE